MSEIKIANSILNLPNWVDQSTLIDPATGQTWVQVPLKAGFTTSWGGAVVALSNGSPQPGINGSDAFKPQANAVVFRNPS
jgi:hypothetical protein